MPLSLALALMVSYVSMDTCGTSTRPLLNVVAEPSKVRVGTDFRLSQIADLARRSGAGSPSPQGFYSADVLHKVAVRLPAGPDVACPGTMRIEIEVQLANRHIEIGREVQREACRYSAVLQHYQKKAKADEATFALYISELAETLRATPLPELAPADHTQPDAGTQARLQAWVKDIVDQKLDLLHAARIAAQKAVDGPEEMRQLDEACSRGA